MEKVYKFKVVNKNQFSRLEELINLLSELNVKFSIRETCLMDFKTSKPLLFEETPSHLVDLLNSLESYEVKKRIKEFYNYVHKFIELKVNLEELDNDRIIKIEEKINSFN